MHYYTTFVFLFLTYLILVDSPFFNLVEISIKGMLPPLSAFNLDFCWIRFI